MNHTIFFDLDGTLTDSAPGIIHSVQYALKKYGIEAEENDLRSFIGPPLVHSFQERFGFDHDKALEAVAYYREYFTAGGMFENSVYPGVEEMLQKLKEEGLMLAVATSKPEFFSKQILEQILSAELLWTRPARRKWKCSRMLFRNCRWILLRQ